MREIYENALDSVRVGMGFYLADKSYSSRKHAILTLFHAIELLLKEYLYRVNPVLIYRNIDKPIQEDSLTVGIAESLARLENLKLALPSDFQRIIKNIQVRRNRIEHHRYNKKDEDEEVIGESLKFILYFVEHFLKERLEDDIHGSLLQEIQQRVLLYSERKGLAECRFENWLQGQWPTWDRNKEDLPGAFKGTLPCPVCRQECLVIDGMERPFCFWCNTTVDAVDCRSCGRVYLRSDGHACY